MNKFLAKKKTKDVSSTDTQSTTTAVPSLKKDKSRKKKKGEQDPKPELDYKIALPSSDNFRTSLIMPNLSARFSMLREANDPHSLIGKANDDSVITSNPRSRFADFSGSALTDIDEVSSLKEPRPPFGASTRSASYNDGYATDDDSQNGSIMSRARPGEGNMLFGGRQKIYRIPVGDYGAVKNLGTNETRGMRGRALYEDDVAMSDFQRLREKERHRDRERKLADLEREMDGDVLNSPSLSYEEKRETSSSTNSGPSVPSVFGASTASTSVASSVPSSSPNFPPSHSAAPPTKLERSNSRRLYEQGLDQHMTEQQSAAIGRLTSFSRKGSQNGRPPYQSRSASNLQERYSSEQSTAESSRAPSPLRPPPSKLSTFDSVRAMKSANGNNGNSSPQTSNSPVFGLQNPEVEQVWNQTVDISDRGKATALGTFNKPQQFDEQQYLARQRSLQQQASLRDASRSRSRDDHPSSSYSRPSTDGQQQRPSVFDNARNNSGTRTDRSWSNSSGRFTKNMVSPMKISTKPGPRPTKLDSPIKTVPKSRSREQMPNLTTSRNVDDQGIYLQASQEDNSNPKISFERGSAEDLPAPLRQAAPSLRDHPAMRNVTGTSGRSSREDKRWALSPDSELAGFIPPKSSDGSSARDNTQAFEAANPEIAPPSQINESILAGFVRGHLRHPSSQSSIYPPTDVGQQEKAEEFPGNDFRIPSMYGELANPWGIELGSPAQISGHGSEPSTHLEVGKTTRYGDPRESRAKHDPTPGDAAQWMQDLRTKHERGESTETQHEREAFEKELAQRQKAIQENLRARAEQISRMPHPNQMASKQDTLKFGPLRAKTSRESMGKSDSPTKSTRMFGLSGSSGNSTLKGGDRSSAEDARKSQHSAGVAPVGRTLHSRLPPQNDELNSYQPQVVVRARQNSLANERNFVPRSLPDSSRSSASRERSDSAASARARRPRVDLSIHSVQSNSAVSSAPSSARPSDIHRQDFPTPATSTRPSTESSRLRSDSTTSNRGQTIIRSQQSTPQMRSNDNFRSNGLESSNNLAKEESNPQSVHDATILSPSVYSGFPGHTKSNTKAAQGQPKTNSSTNPNHTPPTNFNFPARTAAERPSAQVAARRAEGSFGESPIRKEDISDPTFISSTSNFDTVELPDGATLRNGANGGSDSVLDGIGATSPTSNGSADHSPILDGNNRSQLSPLQTSATNAAHKRGFMRNFARRSPGGAEGNGPSAGIEAPVEEPQDDYFKDRKGGRLRMRKFSNAADGAAARGRRHETVAADLVEETEKLGGQPVNKVQTGVVGGMF